MGRNILLRHNKFTKTSIRIQPASDPDILSPYEKGLYSSGTLEKLGIILLAEKRMGSLHTGIP